MKTEFENVTKTLTAYLDNEIDHHGAVDIRMEIDSQIQNLKPKKLILDYADVSFMDSSGIGLIMGRHKLIQSIGGEIEVRNVPQRLYKVVKISGIEKLGKVSVKENGGKK